MKHGTNKQTDTIRNHIVHALANGQFCSGEALGEQLGISRAAVSKYIKALGELGLNIFSVTGKGYRLAEPIQLLDGEAIALHCQRFDTKQLKLLNVIDSTNQYLKDRISTLTSGDVCLAEAQTAGRGRRGRTWVSPYGASLYLSQFWQFAGGYQSIGGLSLAVGVAITQALEKAGYQGIELKWPNDIYARGKKLAGVLIEVEGQMGSACDCIIGVGLNMALDLGSEQIDQPWIDLTTLNPDGFDRNRISALLLDELTHCADVFSQSGLASFLDTWRERNVFRDKPITLIIGNRTVQGICKGIDATGALLLQQENGVHAYNGGEISVRAN
ncbi:bifunctional biotin--[acetyl-CoA-carboxylase] ligase/biotin operon repressor BirA [Paraglaciecola polaris]|uniref:Bifunctional ligase/repressor BirA n=1 Tax=Paraglaciecola polaris LMG 21857 TaxID=1129793 RepID=K6YL48_9ALTE|nr:bifunctional biotin--[acetyl-CoA-carboxylase] ligase/biotin operon repressor BirA [Paraglaciecola polaris]GAC33429.1 BirA family transcriptional regulator, biotin operon repressor [Paraglaciecola polaris LMG 21857]